MIGLLVACGAAVLGVLLVTLDPAGRRLRTVLPQLRGKPRGETRFSRSGAATGSDQGAGPEATSAPEAAPGSEASTGSSAVADDPHRAIAVIDRAAALLRIGMPPATVTTQLAEVSDPDLAAVLIRVSRSMSLGDDPRTAIARHVGGLPPTLAEVLVGMGAVWEVAESAGAPAADVLTRYAHSRREIADAERERLVALAGPQATVTVLTWLPAAGLGLALLIGADLGSLLGSPLGLASIGGGVILLACGRVWMTRMLEKAT
ncbi:MAG: type II secretion system F family protein [Brevibacterium yomogidense]